VADGVEDGEDTTSEQTPESDSTEAVPDMVKTTTDRTPTQLLMLLAEDQDSHTQPEVLDNGGWSDSTETTSLIESESETELTAHNVEIDLPEPRL
jgi:hypothetical protein